MYMFYILASKTGNFKSDPVSVVGISDPQYTGRLNLSYTLNKKNFVEAERVVQCSSREEEAFNMMVKMSMKWGVDVRLYETKVYPDGTTGETDCVNTYYRDRFVY